MSNGKGFASSGTVVGRTPRSRRDQRFDNLKGNKVTMGKNAPQQSEGAVGDITVREISVLGLRCYIKTNSGWFDINTLASAEQVSWIPMILSNDWTADATFAEPAYFKDANGFVHLRGAVDDQDTSVSNRTDDITTLPPGFRPLKSVFKIVPREALSELQLIRIQADGGLNCPQAYTLTVSAGDHDEIDVNLAKAVYFDGISFYAGQSITGSGGGSATGAGGGGSGGTGT
jgi:hypothetical protein